MATPDARILIAGAGLGGLTLALCLQRAGFGVTVLEQATALAEVGAGVQISANGARVLHTLGLEHALQAVAFRPERGEMRHWKSGEVMLTRPLGKTSEERFGFPYYHLHRADLHQVLARALDERAPASVRLGQRVSGFEQMANGVRVRTDSGETFDADLLVGADGIHSRVRAQLFGPDSPRFTTCVAWRALVPSSDLPPGHVRPVASNWLGPGGHFVHYYVRAGALVNCVGIYENREWTTESWSATGDLAAFRADYADWHADLRMLVERATQCHRWGLFDRDPMPSWSDGPVTLLGDACHAMLPFQAQGAVMAMEDAYTLAACLHANADVSRACECYEALRLERTATVQKMSRANAEFFHNPEIGNLAERLEAHREAHLWLYGFDVTSQAFSSTSAPG